MTQDSDDILVDEDITDADLLRQLADELAPDGKLFGVQGDG